MLPYCRNKIFSSGELTSHLPSRVDSRPSRSVLCRCLNLVLTLVDYLILYDTPVSCGSDLLTPDFETSVDGPSSCHNECDVVGTGKGQCSSCEFVFCMVTTRGLVPGSVQAPCFGVRTSTHHHPLHLNEKQGWVLEILYSNKDSLVEITSRRVAERRPEEDLTRRYHVTLLRVLRDPPDTLDPPALPDLDPSVDPTDHIDHPCGEKGNLS